MLNIMKLTLPFEYNHYLSTYGKKSLENEANMFLGFFLPFWSVSLAHLWDKNIVSAPQKVSNKKFKFFVSHWPRTLPSFSHGAQIIWQIAKEFPEIFLSSFFFWVEFVKLFGQPEGSSCSSSPTKNLVAPLRIRCNLDTIRALTNEFYWVSVFTRENWLDLNILDRHASPIFSFVFLQCNFFKIASGASNVF